MSEQNDSIVKLEDLLTPREFSAYRAYMKLNQPPMSPRLQAELFNLFLEGYSCEHIATLNHQFGNASLGMIVRARVENDWDKRKADYMQQLMEGVRSRAYQSTMQSINFISDLIATATKKYGARMQKYIQTGNEEELGDDKMGINSIQNFVKVAELLFKLTGQENNKKQVIDGVVEHRHTVESAPRQMSPEEAAMVLKTIEGSKKK